MYDEISRVIGKPDAPSNTICTHWLVPEISALGFYFLVLHFEPILFGKDHPLSVLFLFIHKVLRELKRGSALNGGHLGRSNAHQFPMKQPPQPSVSPVCFSFLFPVCWKHLISSFITFRHPWDLNPFSILIFLCTQWDLVAPAWTYQWIYLSATFWVALGQLGELAELQKVKAWWLLEHSLPLAPSHLSFITPHFLYPN